MFFTEIVAFMFLTTTAYPQPLFKSVIANIFVLHSCVSGHCNFRNQNFFGFDKSSFLRKVSNQNNNKGFSVSIVQFPNDIFSLGAKPKIPLVPMGINSYIILFPYSHFNSPVREWTTFVFISQNFEISGIAGFRDSLR